jgi:DNA invertase Pin-like site-specific DNA recombinase
MSGVREDRPGLAKLLEYIRAGDTVVVVALDRLGRSLSAVIRTIEKLTERGVLLRSLREGIDYSTPTGRMLAGIFAALAGYERELMHERAAAARQAAPAARPAHRPATAADPGSGSPGALAARRRGADQRPDAQLRRLPSDHLPRARPSQPYGSRAEFGVDAAVRARAQDETPAMWPRPVITKHFGKTRPVNDTGGTS